MAALPPLNALRAFEAVARLGSLTRAAAELHVTHGAISRHLRTLEQSLGRALLLRQGRGVALTDAGERLRHVAGDAFAQLREGWQALQREGTGAPLVLGCSGSVLARWMIPRMADLERQLPGLQLHLAAQEGMPDAALAGLDAALLLAAPPWPGAWRVHELAGERIGPVLAAGHPLAAGLAGTAPQALLELPLLQVASRPQAWPQWSQRMGVDLATADVAASFDHLYYLLEAANAGLGVAIAPQQLVAGDLAAGRLVAPWGFIDTGGHWILATPARVADPRTERLAAWLRSELQAAPSGAL
ncbi:LysR family transcriptional regulator [Stenotrophomonas sp. MMGLT7]|uniref:LysR family transcriptional regulator n=1 Tax=Stenotrophomonas sp. MMGLT7 TaxID=2901227 RepID=UPI001E59CDE7|nr:LysR family transcriptional regulator [Stenotrophomonas sp. MMGLT7]MCD7098673.1 LysR family transcriptional regulator [Stenotrophomonas sp. MMGLT7]